MPPGRGEGRRLPGVWLKEVADWVLQPGMSAGGEWGVGGGRSDPACPGAVSWHTPSHGCRRLQRRPHSRPKFCISNRAAEQEWGCDGVGDGKLTRPALTF